MSNLSGLDVANVEYWLKLELYIFLNSIYSCLYSIYVFGWTKLWQLVRYTGGTRSSNLQKQSLDKVAAAMSFLSVPSGFVTGIGDDVMWNPESMPFRVSADVKK
jgi:hypothetical protein